MYGLAHLLLLLVHAFYGFNNFFISLVPLRQPKPLLAKRRKLPTHLALLLIPDAENHDTREEERVMEECVEHVVEWCKELGIQRLSVYDRDSTWPGLSSMFLLIWCQVYLVASPYMRHPHSLVDFWRPKTINLSAWSHSRRRFLIQTLLEPSPQTLNQSLALLVLFIYPTFFAASLWIMRRKIRQPRGVVIPVSLECLLLKFSLNYHRTV